jgi:hypothetical protein
MRMPDDDKLEIAMLWLRYNESGGLEGEACREVADWIEYLQRERFIRDVAKKAGVPMAVARRRLEALGERSPSDHTFSPVDGERE